MMVLGALPQCMKVLLEVVGWLVAQEHALPLMVDPMISTTPCLPYPGRSLQPLVVVVVPVVCCA